MAARPHHRRRKKGLTLNDDQLRRISSVAQLASDVECAISRVMKRRLSFLACCSLLAVACDAPPAAQSNSSAQPSGTAKPSTASAATPAPLKVSNSKEYKNTAADVLGTLPDKVGIAVGAKAPAFTLHDTKGGVVTLANVLAKGPAMMVFYRGGW